MIRDVLPNFGPTVNTEYLLSGHCFGSVFVLYESKPASFFLLTKKWRTCFWTTDNTKGSSQYRFSFSSLSVKGVLCAEKMLFKSGRQPNEGQSFIHTLIIHQLQQRHFAIKLIGSNQAVQWNENIISLGLTICAIWKPVNSIVRLNSNIKDCSADYRIKFALI